jgi:uncharacterized protein
MADRRTIGALAAMLAAVAMPAGAADGDRPGPSVPVAPSRFGERPPDMAYGAFQRGLYLTALRLATPRAEEGDGPAQELVAQIHARGLGVPRDRAKAAGWYEKAAAQGIATAQLQFALMLLEGRHVTRDRDRARMLLRAAADAGNVAAQFNYAQLLLEESGEVPAAEAVAYYERAAAAGLADAQYAMGLVYLDGLGGRPVSAADARRWLLRAARQNFDSAQVELATLLVEARNAADEKEGFAWMKRAAEAGNVAARNRLAKLYQRAIGTEADPVAAAAWYMSARRRGLTDGEMEDFLLGLDDEQLAEARATAETLR